MIRFLPLKRLKHSAVVRNSAILAGISYQDAISHHRHQYLLYFYEALATPEGKDRNMVTVNGNSISNSTLHCFFNSFRVQVCFLIWDIPVLPRSTFVKLMRFLSGSTTFLVIGC